jgi:hypothetical protein
MIQQQSKADACVDRILVALAKVHGHTLLRDTIRAKTLDSRLSAAELSAVRDSHPLIQEFVVIDTSEIGRNKRAVEKWVLRPEALQNQFKLKHIFAYRTPLAEIYPEPKPVLPSQPPAAPPVALPVAIEVPEVVDGLTIQALALMPYAAFEVLSEEQRSRLPIRNKNVSVYEHKDRCTPEVWAQIEKEKEFWSQTKNKPVVPAEYFGTEAEIQARQNNALIVEQYSYGTSRVAPIFLTPNKTLHKYGSTAPVIIGLTHRVVVNRAGGNAKGELQDSEGTKCHVIRIRVDQPSPLHRVELLNGRLQWTDAPPPPEPSRFELEKMPVVPLDCMKSAYPTTRLTLKDARPSMKLVTGADGKPEWRTVEATLSTASFEPRTFSVAERAASRGVHAQKRNKSTNPYEPYERYDPMKAYLANKDAC